MNNLGNLLHNRDELIGQGRSQQAANGPVDVIEDVIQALQRAPQSIGLILSSTVILLTELSENHSLKAHHVVRLLHGLDHAKLLLSKLRTALRQVLEPLDWILQQLAVVLGC